MRVRSYALCFALCLAAYYGIEAALALVIFPESGPGGLDTSYAENTVFSTEERYILYNHGALLVPGPKVVVLGASPSRLALRPRELGAHLAGATVHNLSLAGSDIYETAQIVDVLCNELSRDRIKETTFVLGLVYMQFVDQHRRWPGGRTRIDEEAMRYHLYEPHADSGWRPVIASEAKKIALQGLRPMMAFSFAYQETIERLSLQVRLWGRMALDEKLLLFNAMSGERESPEEKRREVEEWGQLMGPVEQITDAQYKTMLRLAHRISQSGAHLLIVDLPLPQWHMKASAHFADYQQRKRPYLESSVNLPGVSSLDLQNENPETGFYDSVHPMHWITARWSEKVAGALLDSNGALAHSARH